ncbi:ATPase [Kocuria sp. JC486]|uniref:N-acetylglucosamine kinase n=1 Tax=Kocuria sp. JC486 TaxID=1970736 RepID=UPI00141FE2F5|nr:BadF/BadG/BcrA/BcrD ATPase family protein [Kocuria sp. JC486]NHU85389.1 ATPase [Kocuria sp. JC486]
MPTTVFGLDIGGTSTHGIRAQRAQDGWRVLREAKVGSANLQNVSTEQARGEIRAVLAELGMGTTGPQDSVSVIAGSGGVDTLADQDRLREMIHSAAPEVSTDLIHVVHDSRLILAAHGLDVGVSVIAGTGSVAWGSAATGREARAGGWGHLLGDEGSSWWVAREAVRRALERADRQEEADELDLAVLQARGLETRADLIADFHTHPDRTGWSELATVVDRSAGQGSQAAVELLTAAADQLLTMTQRVCQSLDLTGPVVAGGGLIQHSGTVRDRFVTRAGARGIEGVHVLDVAPVMGTLHLADHAPNG